jgi:hypothetical protein
MQPIANTPAGQNADHCRDGNDAHQGRQSHAHGTTACAVDRHDSEQRHY